MALTNAYCTLADMKYLSRLTDADDDVILEMVINSASRMIDRYTGRRHGFWQDSTVATRQYHADDSWTVQTDDISTTTGLVVKVDTANDGSFSTTLTITTDFLCYPLNSEDETPVRPFDELRIAAGSSHMFICDGHRPGVQVTAKFGWAAVPDEVRLATVMQAQMLYSAKDARAGIVQTGDGYPTRMSRYLHPQAELLLGDFVKAPR